MKTPKFTKAHFEYLARMFAEESIEGKVGCRTMAKWLQETNPAFNPDRFLAACQPKEEAYDLGPEGNTCEATSPRYREQAPTDEVKSE